MTKAQIRLAQPSIGKKRDEHSRAVQKNLELEEQRFYRYVDPNGGLRKYGERILFFYFLNS